MSTGFTSHPCHLPTAPMLEENSSKANKNIYSQFPKAVRMSQATQFLRVYKRSVPLVTQIWAASLPCAGTTVFMNEHNRVKKCVKTEEELLESGWLQMT